MMRSLFLLSLVASIGCASSPAPSSATPDGTEPEVEGAEEEEAAPPPPKSKSDQCHVLGEAIENGIAGGTKIVSLNDSESIAKLREEWSGAVQRIGAVESDLPELVSLRDEVAALARKKAEALDTVAGAGPEPEKKAALARYRELSGEFDGLVDRFNAICGV